MDETLHHTMASETRHPLVHTQTNKHTCSMCVAQEDDRRVNLLNFLYCIACLDKIEDGVTRMLSGDDDLSCVTPATVRVRVHVSEARSTLLYHPAVLLAAAGGNGLHAYLSSVYICVARLWAGLTSWVAPPPL